MVDGTRSERGASAPPTSPQSPTLNRRSGLVWLAYLALFVFSVPWYFPAGTGEPFVFGVPLWCLVALLCYVLIALLTAWRLDAVWARATMDAEQERSGAAVGGGRRREG